MTEEKKYETNCRFRTQRKAVYVLGGSVCFKTTGGNKQKEEINDIIIEINLAIASAMKRKVGNICETAQV